MFATEYRIQYRTADKDIVDCDPGTDLSALRREAAAISKRAGVTWVRILELPSNASFGTYKHGKRV